MQNWISWFWCFFKNGGRARDNEKVTITKKCHNHINRRTTNRLLMHFASLGLLLMEYYKHTMYIVYVLGVKDKHTCAWAYV